MATPRAFQRELALSSRLAAGLDFTLTNSLYKAFSETDPIVKSASFLAYITGQFRVPLPLHLGASDYFRMCCQDTHILKEHHHVSFLSAKRLYASAWVIRFCSQYCAFSVKAWWYLRLKLFCLKCFYQLSNPTFFLERTGRARVYLNLADLFRKKVETESAFRAEWQYVYQLPERYHKPTAKRCDSARKTVLLGSNMVICPLYLFSYPLHKTFILFPCLFASILQMRQIWRWWHDDRLCHRQQLGLLL